MWFGVRPEAISLQKPDAGQLAIEKPWLVAGRVVDVEALGDATLVHLVLSEGDGGTPPLVCKAPATTNWVEGDAIRAAFDPQGVHWFEKSSGRRLV